MYASFCIFKKHFCKVSKSLIHHIDLLPTFSLMDGKAVIKEKGSSKVAAGKCFAESKPQVYKPL